MTLLKIFSILNKNIPFCFFFYTQTKIMTFLRATFFPMTFFLWFFSYPNNAHLMTFMLLRPLNLLTVLGSWLCCASMMSLNSYRLYAWYVQDEHLTSNTRTELKYNTINLCLNTLLGPFNWTNEFALGFFSVWIKTDSKFTSRVNFSDNYLLGYRRRVVTIITSPFLSLCYYRSV